MTLEYWDTQRKKYVLYFSGADHANDCDQFPFEKIPRRVFLDTNVINIIVKHAAEIFDGELIDTNDQTLACDIEALRHVFFVGARANWDIRASQKVIDEISNTKNDALRGDLLEYAIQILNSGLSEEDRRFGVNFGRKLIDAPFAAALPDAADRQLIGNAIGFGCDSFCTCDRTTIINKRHQLKQIPLRILTPAEWWACIKPWAALWC